MSKDGGYSGMYFIRHKDGSVTINNPSDKASWALGLLESARADSGLTWENGVVTFTDRSGTYRWREVGREDLGDGHVVVETVSAPDAPTPLRLT